MSDHDPRLDLPGSSTAPVEGGQWLRIKVIVWTIVIVLMIAAAALFARLATDVAGSAPKLSLPPVSLESLVKGDPERRREANPAPTVEEKPFETSKDAATDGDGIADPELMTHPAWLARPAPEYPVQAMRAGIEKGAVAMNCGVTVEGWLSDCRILSETPPGHGFADATLRSAQSVRMRPRIVNGEPVEARVEYTTRYRLD